MSYTLTVKSYSGSTAVLTLSSTSTISTAFLIRAKAYSDSAGTQSVAESGWVTPPSSSTEMDFTLSIATPGTYYVTVESDEPETLLSLESVVLPNNTPKTATVSQWEDLATKVKAKANTSSLSSVATSGSYNDLSNKPTVPTITMTTTDPGEGAVLAADNYIAVYGGDPIIMDYSTTEINTGAKWIDGSAIYKKTINFGALPNNTEKSVAHNISNIESIIKVEGFAKNNNSSNQIPLPFTSTTAANQIYVLSTSTNIVIGSGVDRSSLFGYVTLYYTKSS